MRYLKSFLLVVLFGLFFRLGNFQYAIGATLGGIFLVLVQIRNELEKPNHGNKEEV